MVQATTPTFVLTLPANTVDLTQAEHVYFTIEQGNVVIDKSDADLEVTERVVNVYLTQAETLRLTFYSEAKIQLNWTYLDGSRACSEVKTIVVGENLHKAVI